MGFIRFLLALMLYAAVAVSLASGIAYSADGDLDPTFNGNGLVTTNFHNTLDDARAVAIQPDGKIVVAGVVCYNFVACNWAVVRYLTDGNLDSSFGYGGMFWSVFKPCSCGFHHAAANGVALQADGKIVVAGYSIHDSTPADFGVARLHTNGTLDTSFSGDGRLTINFFGGHDEIRAVAIQPDGKIVAAGNAQVSGFNYDFALARFLPNGNLDNSFDGDGKATVDFFGGDDGAYAMALQNNGAIVAAGGAYYQPSSYNFGVARLLSNGALDTSFGVGGIKAEDLGAIDEARSVAIQADGKIVAAGYAAVNGVNHFAVARFTLDGFLDSGFGGGDGWLTTDFGGSDAKAYGVAIQGDGKIVAAGGAYMSDTNHYDYAVARYILGDLPDPPAAVSVYLPIMPK